MYKLVFKRYGKASETIRGLTLSDGTKLIRELSLDKTVVRIPTLGVDDSWVLDQDRFQEQGK